MPTYMDTHIILGKNAVFIAEEYCDYITTHKNNNCKYLNYWINENKDNVFFLIEAPNKESIINLHHKVDGLDPKEIILLNPKISAALLNQIPEVETSIDLKPSEIKIFNQPDYKAFLVTSTLNSRLLQHKIGIHKAYKLLSLHDEVIFQQIHKYGGHEIESEDEGVIASFTSSCQALECANSIQKELGHIAGSINLRVGVHAGVPVSINNVQYDDIIKFARYLCNLGLKKQIVISSMVHELYTEYYDPKIMSDPDRIRWLFPCEGEFLELLMDTLTKNWRNPKLEINDFCKQMSISKSQLYRKCKSIIGTSLNTVLQDYRLSKSLEILNKTDSNISQTAFETGFTSPSYFAKCFQKKFGLQPTSFLKNSVAT